MRLATQSDLTTGTIYSLIMSTYLSSLLNDYRSNRDTKFYKYSIQLSNIFLTENSRFLTYLTIEC